MADKPPTYIPCSDADEEEREEEDEEDREAGEMTSEADRSTQQTMPPGSEGNQTSRYKSDGSLPPDEAHNAMDEEAVYKRGQRFKKLERMLNSPLVRVF